MAKTMCSLKKKDSKEGLDEVREVIGKPKYFCKKCLRAAEDKKNLCKPEKI